MTLEEIKAAVEAGKTVHWSNDSYVVQKFILRDGGEQWLIKCLNNQSCIGLTHADGVTMNGKEAQFYTDPPEDPVKKQIKLLTSIQPTDKDSKSLCILTMLNRNDIEKILRTQYMVRYGGYNSISYDDDVPSVHREMPINMESIDVFTDNLELFSETVCHFTPALPTEGREIVVTATDVYWRWTNVETGELRESDLVCIDAIKAAF